MPQSDDNFHDLMKRVLTGSDQAARELFHHYEPFLLHAIRRRLNKKIRSKFDSLDFAQDVWASFFAELPEKRAFKDPEELIAFLTRLAQNKVIDAVRQRLMTQKHNVNRERSLDDSRRFEKEELVAKQESPSQILMNQEEWREFLSKQPLVYRRIFILLREGKTPEEVSREMGISARTVRRVVAARSSVKESS